MRYRLRRLTRRAEEGAMALIPALIFVIIALGLVSFMTVATTKSLQKGQISQDMGSSMNAADSGIANMMTAANSTRYIQAGVQPVFESHLGVEHAVYGKYDANENNSQGDGAYGWRWYAERATDSSAGTTYYVYSTGYQDSPNDEDARTIRVTVSSVTTEGVSYKNDGSVTYVSTKAGSFAFNGLGTQSVEMGANTTANVYDSSKNIGYPVTSLNTGRVGTSGTATFNKNVASNIAFLVAGSNSSSQDLLNKLCSGEGCKTTNASLFNYNISLQASRNEALKACSGSSYPDWKASEHGGEIDYTSSKMCYNNIIFDTDTKLSPSWSSGNPAVMYAQGSIKVNPGVEVAQQKSTSQGPFTLQITSTGNTDFTVNRGTTVNPTKFTGVVVGNALNCDLGGSSSSDTSANTAVLYGSAACKTFVARPGTSMWWDSQLDKVLKEGSITAKRIWTTTDYEEV